MSTDVTKTSEFKSICSFNPVNQTVHDSALERISSVVFSVISDLQSTDKELDSESIATFSEKIGQINTKLKDEGKGTPFTVALYTMSLLTDLRAKLSPENQDVLTNPFIARLKELAEQDTIKDKVGVATQLYNFQKNVLNPALLKAESREELAALKPLVQLVFTIKSKVEEVDPNGKLDELKKASYENYNYTYFTADPGYQALINYAPGSISNLESSQSRAKVISKLTEVQQVIARIADNPHMPTKDKVALYQAFTQIQKEFGENGAELNEVIDALETTLDLHKGIKSSFPLEMKELLSNPISGELSPIATKLVAFERDHLIPALQHMATREELLALEPLVDQCIDLKPKVDSADAEGRLSETHAAMIDLYNAKLQKTNVNFAPLISYTPGKLGDLSNSARREKLANSLAEYIEGAIKSFDHPIFQQEEKMALYEAVLKIQSEFNDHKDGARLEPTAKALRKALSIPEPELAKVKPEPKAKSSLFAMWEKRASESGSENSSPKSTTIPSKKEVEVSPEVRRQKSLQIIQEKLGSLDLNSQFLSEDISYIKSQISTLRSISGNPVEFKHLEKAFDVLLNPETLAVSSEEKFLMGFVLEKHKLSKLDLAKFVKKDEDINKPDVLKKVSARVLASYVDQERVTVFDAQSNMLRALKQKAFHPEQLEATASRAVDIARSTAKQMRFRRFTDLYTLNPALNHNFTANYSTLVQTFELFTRETVMPDLEKNWSKLATAYDSPTSGKFSELLTNYSYMNPRRQFSIYVASCQEDFLNSLGLQLIDRTPLRELEPYLSQKVEEHKTDGAKTFLINYEDHFQEEHLWLFDNAHRIVMPHNQGDNDNTNLGKGVCYNNSLSRMSTLMRDPTMDRSTLQMGSTERTRFHQNLVGRKVEKAKDGAMSWDEATRAIKDNCEVYGLRHHHTTSPFSSDGGLYENLATKMEEFSNLGYSQVILGLRDPKTGTGHAVNLIFDKAHGIYSIEDDNLGRIEFSNLKELQAQGKEYFKIFYPHNTELTFECYALAK